ncbi:hypothetical protein FQR65_LT02693 [Abscondita terminalis]|nr:hypothetical protein FQR65_LT02693 [Abscondita terminalis]
MDRAPADSSRAMFYKTRTCTRLMVDVLRNEFEKTRRDSRLTLMLRKRNIGKSMSPILSPVPVVEEKPVVRGKSKRRMSMLRKYKEEKKKKTEEEKAKMKPIFKVYHVQHSPVTDYTKMYKHIKGKEVKVINQQNSFKLAPSSTYKFKPPANIKPIQMGVVKSNAKSKTSRKLDFDTNRSNECTTQNNNRNVVSTSSQNPKTNKVVRQKSDRIEINRQKNLAVNVDLKQKSNSKDFKIRVNDSGLAVESTDKSTKKQVTDFNNTNGLVSTSAQKTDSAKITKLLQTPIPTKAIVLSPFVTMSRGKDKAVREYRNRWSNNSPAPYFSNLLVQETQRLEELCEEWRKYEEEIKPPEEACDMIRVAIGQTDLLLRKKFKKFSELIDLCKSNEEERKITYSDLSGFWDNTLVQVRSSPTRYFYFKICFQVKNLNQRFNNLTQLKANNWEEIVPPPVMKRTKKVKNVKKSEIKSVIGDAIREARRKNMRANQHSSPSVQLVTTRSLSNISNLLSTEKTPTSDFTKNTPKSILKSNKRSSMRKSKSVLFIDMADKENLLNPSDLITFTPSPRRSQRLINRRIEDGF